MIVGIYTRVDGGVTECYPDPNCIEAMRMGGWWDQYPEHVVKDQVRRQMEDGISRHAAQRFFDALGDGGLSHMEAVDTILQRDCAHLGYGLEQWHISQLPKDQWFRDAWTRSHNGGPISISLKKARQVQFRHIRRALRAKERRLRASVYAVDDSVSIDLDAIRKSILHAEDVEELRAIWPEELKE